MTLNVAETSVVNSRPSVQYGANLLYVCIPVLRPIIHWTYSFYHPLTESLQNECCFLYVGSSTRVSVKLDT